VFPFALALAFASPQQPDAEKDPTPKAVNTALYATVRILNLGVDARTASGVTIGVRDGFAYVLTANHALGQEGERRVEFFLPESGSEPEYVAESKDVIVLVKQPPADFAVVKVGLKRSGKAEYKPRIAPLPPALDRPKHFPVTAYSAGCSSPAGKDPNDPANRPVPVLVPTRIIEKRFVRNRANEIAGFWESDTPQEKGRSGGALLDARGRVLGVLAANELSQQHAYFTHLDEIQSWLKKNGYSEFFAEK
jgi:S1-C subfamily serine protease